jgi:hypothetical protein
MARRVALVRTDVSVERSASIKKMTRIGQLGTTLAVTRNRRTLRRNTMWESYNFGNCTYNCLHFWNVCSLSTQYMIFEFNIGSSARILLLPTLPTTVARICYFPVNWVTAVFGETLWCKPASRHSTALWHTRQVLGNDCVIDNYEPAVAE